MLTQALAVASSSSWQMQVHQAWLCAQCSWACHEQCCVQGATQSAPVGQSKVQTQGVITDSELGLTHNQAAQKASEEQLRNNAGRLFPEE